MNNTSVALFINSNDLWSIINGSYVNLLWILCANKVKHLAKYH